MSLYTGYLRRTDVKLCEINNFRYPSKLHAAEILQAAYMGKKVAIVGYDLAVQLHVFKENVPERFFSYGAILLSKLYIDHLIFQFLYFT